MARRPDTFDATSELAQRAGVAFALFVMLTPFPATVDFERWEKAQQTRARELFVSKLYREMYAGTGIATDKGAKGGEHVSGNAYLGSLPGACFRGNLCRIWKILRAANR